MKTFRGDLEKMRDWLKERRPFAFSRFGEGELRILTGELRNYSEFGYDPSDRGYLFLRDRLFDSFRYRHTNYYVGISCPACVGQERFAWAKEASEQPEEQLTWATLLVNANYSYFREECVPLFSSYNVYLVCHKSANLGDLTFSVTRDFRVEMNAWRNNYSLAHNLAEFNTRNQIKGALFLLCAGPFANILTHQLHARSPENTYLDVGSTFDPLLFGEAGLTRFYLKGRKKYLKKTCCWN